MKTNNCLIKIVTTCILCSILLCISVCYFSMQIHEINEDFIATKNDLQFTSDELAEVKNELEIAQSDLYTEIEKNFKLNNELQSAIEDVNNFKTNKYKLVYMGDFKITYYCDERYNHICGGNGITKSGKTTEVGITAAADWSVLPNGSKVYIEGIGFREIQDIGGAVKENHIDVLVKTHNEAILNGTDFKGIWLLVEP